MLIRNALLVMVAVLAGYQSAARAVEPIAPEQFDKFYKLVRPQADEWTWMKIPWVPTVLEVMKQAAEQGKPILVWSMSAGEALGQC